MHRFTERLREFGVAHRFGHEVDGTDVARVIDRGDVDRDRVVDVHPRDPLRSRSEAPADEELERRRHLGEPATTTDHEPGAHTRDAYTELLRCKCFLLP